MATWWPLATHKIGKAKAVDTVIEPRVGGRWYERGDDGSTCDWGRVPSWEPPSRLVLSWDINADWQYDPNEDPRPIAPPMDALNHLCTTSDRAFAWSIGVTGHGRGVC
jgi:hypothetical protein